MIAIINEASEEYITHCGVAKLHRRDAGPVSQPSKA